MNVILLLVYLSLRIWMLMMHFKLSRMLWDCLPIRRLFTLVIEVYYIWSKTRLSPFITNVSILGGGTEKYIKDLKVLFDHYEHIHPSIDFQKIGYICSSGFFINHTLTHYPIIDLPLPTNNCALLHLHSVMVGVGAIKYVHHSFSQCIEVVIEYVFQVGSHRLFKVVRR